MAIPFQSIFQTFPLSFHIRILLVIVSVSFLWSLSLLRPSLIFRFFFFLFFFFYLLLLILILIFLLLHLLLLLSVRLLWWGLETLKESTSFFRPSTVSIFLFIHWFVFQSARASPDVPGRPRTSPGVPWRLHRPQEIISTPAVPIKKLRALIR